MTDSIEIWSGTADVLMQGDRVLRVYRRGVDTADLSWPVSMLPDKKVLVMQGCDGSRVKLRPMDYGFSEVVETNTTSLSEDGKVWLRWQGSGDEAWLAADTAVHFIANRDTPRVAVLYGGRRLLTWRGRRVPSCRRCRQHGHSLRVGEADDVRNNGQRSTCFAMSFERPLRPRPLITQLP